MTYRRYPAGYAADAAVTAYAANKAARRLVRQGMPPDAAADLAARGMMVMGGVGILLLYAIGFILWCLPYSLLHGNWFTAAACVLSALIAWRPVGSGLIYTKVAPHRRTDRQVARANPWHIIGWMLAFYPLVITLVLVASSLDNRVW